MAKRMILMLVVALGLVAGLGFVKFRQIHTAMAQGASFAPPPSAVTTIVAKRETWPSTLNVIGTAQAIQGVTVSADLPGTVARINFNRAQELVKQGVLAQTEYDNTSAQQKSTEAQVGEIRATIERKTIRAPFSGILGLRQVNLGQYLAAGQAIVPLQSLNPIYVNFGVPQQTAAQARVGRTLQVTSDNLPGDVFTGRVTAADSVVNEAT